MFRRSSCEVTVFLVFYFHGVVCQESEASEKVKFTKVNKRYMRNTKDLQNSCCSQNKDVGKLRRFWWSIAAWYRQQLGVLFSYRLSVMCFRGDSRDLGLRNVQRRRLTRWFFFSFHTHSRCFVQEDKRHVPPTRTVSFVSCSLSTPSFIFTFLRRAVRRHNVSQLTVSSWIFYKRALQMCLLYTYPKAKMHKKPMLHAGIDTLSGIPETPTASVAYQACILPNPVWNAELSAVLVLWQTITWNRTIKFGSFTFIKKLKADWSQAMLATIRSRILCLPFFYPHR